ncbi:zinc finger protein 474-like [Pollicipes pollicipes]|uniref:zinc finger protein 474-like n=1 Tax=Pollicipes pollicipes TaxID=41117 RepID=UPI00188598FB|nr:zinc finger protein 474-like [Pollicipes pollicipes]
MSDARGHEAAAVSAASPSSDTTRGRSAPFTSDPAAAGYVEQAPAPADPTDAVQQSRPPAFVDCYVCQKQFGSHSVALHEPRCLRAVTPTKPSVESPQAPPASSLNSSWPRSNGRMRAALEEQASPRVSRPRTAVLKKPRMLDAGKCKELDMSTTRCSELLDIVSQNAQRRKARAASEERPRTIRLTQASRDLDVPNIDYRAAQPALISPDRGRAKPGRRLPNFTRALEQLFNAPRAKAGVPKPCMSCGKPENPERFHSHPADPPAETTKRRNERKPKKRLSTQRPVAIKYRPPPAVPPPPPNMDPVAQRKQQLEEEQRQKQARLKEEYLKKEEKSRKAREDAMRKKLAFTLSKHERPTNGSNGTSKIVVCYICEKQFGANSLPIHQPQCLEKWRRENEALPEHQRRPEPQPPSQAQTGLVPCCHCGRTFFPDRVALHEKNCQPKDGDAVTKEAPTQSQPTVCYICKARLPPEQMAAHELECVKRWRAENAVITQQIALPTDAPRSDGVTVEPADVPGPAEQLEGQLDAMIDAAWQNHLSELVPCPNCARTFFPDRLEKHKKNCRVEIKHK